MADSGPASPGTPPEESPGALSQIAEDEMVDGPHNQLLMIDIDGAAAPKHSLQDAFRKFRKKKQKEIKKAKKRKEIPEEVRLRATSTPDRMWRLRMKFLNQAKKYFGVPYAKKYWKPEDPEYASPMFLDCCGLVRRCLKDLRKSFGFNVGPWNQAYQFDTLPVTVEREEDMKPGDLVFISATYNNPKSKKQKHDMTHVEIWLGDGPKTIGARWQKGKVQVFDSYKFNAKAYHSETYIFKSIDTWLMGICRSHCPHHNWKTRAQKFKPSKKSIFVQKEGDNSPSSSQREQQQEQSAGGSHSDTDSLDLLEEVGAEDMVRLSLTTAKVDALEQGVLRVGFVEDDDVDECGDDDDDVDDDEINQNNSNNNNSEQENSEKPPGGLSPDVIPNGRRWRADTAVKKSPDAPRKDRTPVTAQKDKTFFVGGNNGVGLVEEALLDMGWKKLANKYDESYKLKWVECKNQVNYHAFKTGEQLVNRIPNCALLTNKMGLLTSLQRYDRTTSTVNKKGNRMRYRNFFPETYRIDDPQDRRAFLDTHKPGEIWICKPTGMNQGKGIYLIRDIEAFQRHLEERDERVKRTMRHPAMERIVQRYIADPLLLDERKFDIRAFMLIANTSPYLVLFHQGYARLCLHKYAQDSSDLVAHLTNQFIQKKDSDYHSSKEDTVWSMQKLNDYVNLHFCVPLDLEYDWVYTVLTPKMKQIMLYCFNAVKNKLKCRLGYFDLYGLDFMIDSQMKVNLIEINVNPSLSTNCETLREVIPGIVRESLYVSLECFEKSRLHRPLLPLDKLHEFEVIFNGSTPKPPPKDTRTGSPDARPSRGSPSLSFARSQSPIFFPRSSSPSKDFLRTPAIKKKDGVTESTPMSTVNLKVITTHRSEEKPERILTARKSARKERHTHNKEEERKAKRVASPQLKTPATRERPNSRQSFNSEIMLAPSIPAPMMLPAIEQPISSAFDPMRSSSDPVKFRLTHHHYVSSAGEAPGYYRSATARLTRRRNPKELQEAITKSTATSAIAQCILSAFPKQSEIFQARLEGMKTGEFPPDGYLKGTPVLDSGRKQGSIQRQGRLRDMKKFLLQSKPVLTKICRSEVHSSSAPTRPLRRLPPQKSPIGLELCPIHPDGSRKSAKKSPVAVDPPAEEKDSSEEEKVSNLSCLTFGDLDEKHKKSKRRLSAA